MRPSSVLDRSPAPAGVVGPGPGRSEPATGRAGLRPHDLVLPVAVVLWWVGVQATRPDAMNDYGLLRALPIVFFVAVGLLVGASVAVLLRPVLSPVRLGLHLVALVVMLHATMPLIFDAPIYPWVYKHVGVVGYINLHGGLDTGIDIVAFTDDDVQVDPRWLDGITAGFARDPGAGCVTGLVPPAELDDAAQLFFDRRYTWAAHLDPRVFDLAGRGDDSPLYPYSAGIFGTGANFAVDRALVEGLGGFDEALGAGSPAGGGEDLDVFVRVLRAGRSLVYEPSAIVWHVHRADARALRRQLFYYGVGLTAFLTKYMLDVRTAGEIASRLPAGASRGMRMWSAEEIGGPAPKVLVLAEVAGMFAGPFAYLRGRLRLRRHRRNHSRDAPPGPAPGRGRARSVPTTRERPGAANWGRPVRAAAGRAWCEWVSATRCDAEIRCHPAAARVSSVTEWPILGSWSEARQRALHC